VEIMAGEAVEIVKVDPHLREHKILVPEKNPTPTKLGKRQLYADKAVTIFVEEVVSLSIPFEIDEKWHLCGKGSDGKWYCSLMETS
jgi:hypothetical protein